MAFDVQNVGNQGASFNVPFASGSAPLVGNFTTGTTRLMTYKSTLETLATITGDTYFYSYYPSMTVGDIWFITAVDASGMYQVSDIDTDAQTVTLVAFTPTGSVGTVNIVDQAVTAAKIANATITTTQISASAAIVATQLAANTISSSRLDVSLIQGVSGTLTAANWAAMYGAPVQLIASPGAGKLIVIDSFDLEYVHVTTAFTAGGATLLQYGNTIHGAGPGATATLAAVGFSDQATSQVAKVQGALAAVTASTTANTAIYISNQTAAFATGDGTFVWHINYHVVSVT